METDLTVNPRKRRAESPIPDADVVLDSPEATPLSDIRIDTTKLPPLPSLAPHLQHLPYIRWQKSLPTNTTSFKLLGDHVFHKRQGFVGYAILRMLVVQWLVFAHPYLHASVAARFAHTLTSDAVYATLARAYGMSEKISLAHPDQTTVLAHIPVKILADALRVHFGLLLRNVMDGNRSFSDLEGYTGQLFDSQTFPDLEHQLQKAQQDFLDNTLGRALKRRVKLVTQRQTSTSSSAVYVPTHPAGTPSKHRSDAPIPGCANQHDAVQPRPDSEIPMDMTKLPDLPPLPPHLDHLPYIRNRQGPPSTHSDLVQQNDHVFHQRLELVGDAVLGVLVQAWLVNSHPFLHVGTAAAWSNVLVSNAMFARLARAYRMEEKLALAHPGQAMAAGEEGIKVLANAFEAYFGLLAREVTAGNISWTSLKQYVYDLFGCGAFPDLKARLEAAQKAATASMLMQSPKKRPRLSKEEPPKEGPPNGEPPSKADKQIAIKQKAVKTKAPKRQSIRIRNRNQRALELSGPCASMSLDGPPQETPAFPSQSASARTLVSAETIWEGKTTAQKAAAQSVSGTRRLSMHTLPSLLEMIHVKASKAKPHRRCASEPALSGAGTREFIVVA